MKTAKLFEYGCSQAVRVPAELRFEGENVLIRRAQQQSTSCPITYQEGKSKNLP